MNMHKKLKYLCNENQSPIINHLKLKHYGNKILSLLDMRKRCRKSSGQRRYTSMLRQSDEGTDS